MKALVKLHTLQLNKMQSMKEIQDHLYRLKHGSKVAQQIFVELHDEQGRYMHPTQMYSHSLHGEVFSEKYQRWMSADEVKYFKK